MESGLDEADVGGCGQPATVVGRVSSPLVGYTPPHVPHVPRHGSPLHLKRQTSGKKRGVHSKCPMNHYSLTLPGSYVCWPFIIIMIFRTNFLGGRRGGGTSWLADVVEKGQGPTVVVL